MKTVLILIVAISLTCGLPVDDEKPKPEVIKQEYNNRGDKGYDFE
jgi:hypothetical protein